MQSEYNYEAIESSMLDEIRQYSETTLVPSTSPCSQDFDPDIYFGYIRIAQKSNGNLRDSLLQCVYSILVKNYHLMNTNDQLVTSKSLAMFIAEGVECLRELYAQLTNDTSVCHHPTVTAEWKANILSSIEDHRVDPVPIYEKGEIIGARDGTGKWWLSRVLAVSCIEHVCVYYVEFCGWGPSFNEFISNTNRLEKFNPYRHKYFDTWKK